MGKPPKPPSDNPFLPRSIELTSLDGETDLEALPEVDAAVVEEEPAAAATASGFGTDVEWSDADLGARVASKGVTAAPAAGPRPFGVGLANLDGTVDDVESATAAPPSGPDPFGPPLDLSTPIGPASPGPAPATSSAPTSAPPSSAFAAPSYEDVPIQLNMTLGQLVEQKEAPPPPQPDDIEMVAADPGAFIAIPGRFMEGRLRQQAGLHILIGLVIALGIGYVIARPVQRRSEMRIEYLHQQAATEMQRGHEEATANANRLEKEAEDESTKAFVLVGLLWLGVAGGLFALYWRFT